MAFPSSVKASPIPVETDLHRGWFTEYFSDHESHRHHFKATLVQAHTRFQKAILADSYSFGRCLILDGEIQSAQLDEFIYHECLVQPAMVLHGRAQDVLVLGGGEGATVREILRHRQVKRVTMVDIDGDVVAFCRRYLKEWHQGTLTHPRTRVIIADARKFVLQTSEKFDVIISDLPTAAERGPARALYQVEFYRELLKCLRPNGILVAQAGSGHLLQLGFHSVLYNTLRRVFKVVSPYYAFVPSFDVPWAYLLATQKADPKALSSRVVDQRLGTLRQQLRFYDGEAHQGLFHVPKYVRRILQQEKRIMTERKPITFHG